MNISGCSSDMVEFKSSMQNTKEHTQIFDIPIVCANLTPVASFSNTVKNKTPKFGEQKTSFNFLDKSEKMFSEDSN